MGPLHLCLGGALCSMPSRSCRPVVGPQGCPESGEMLPKGLSWEARGWVCNGLTWEAKLSLSSDLRVNSSDGNERCCPQSRDGNHVIIKQESRNMVGAKLGLVPNLLLWMLDECVICLMLKIWSRVQWNRIISMPELCLFWDISKFYLVTQNLNCYLDSSVR